MAMLNVMECYLSNRTHIERVILFRIEHFKQRCCRIAMEVAVADLVDLITEYASVTIQKNH